jgi:hypothetical protein
MKMEEKSFQYHLAEYTLLRQELHHNAKDSHSSIIYALLANSAVVAWVSSNIENTHQKSLLELAAYLPLFISIVSWLIHLFRRRLVRRISNYCALMERRFALDELGWERFFKTESDKEYFLNSGLVFNAICMLHMSLALYFIYFIRASL